MVLKESLYFLITSGNRCIQGCSLDRDESTCGLTIMQVWPYLLFLWLKSSFTEFTPDVRTLLHFWDCVELSAKLLANYKCATFTSETLSVRDDSECIHYSSPLGLGTDQYAGPIKSHRSWMLRPLAAGQANKVPLRNREGCIPVSLMVNPCILPRRSLCVFEGY